MRIKLLLVAALLAGCTGSPSSFAPGASVVPDASLRLPASSAFPEAPVVASVKGVATIVLTARIDAATGLPTFYFRGSKGVVPTIDVNPGDTIVIDVANQLPASGGMASDMNLHFHGLSVSPNPPADDVVTTLAMPGGYLHYVVPIPKSVEPGLYWYHPHVHGETDYQVGVSGMSGAIVVNGLENHLPGLAKMTQRLMIVRDVAPGVTDDMMGMHVRPHDEDSNPNPCGPDGAGLTTTLNGAVASAIPIAAGERQFFWLINATGHKNLNLAIDGGTLQIVAIDGFALDTYPGTGPTETVSSLVVPPAGRAEFVVTGTGGSAAFRSLCYNSGPTGDPDPQTLLATLHAPAGAPRHAPRAAPLTVGAPLPHNAFSFPLPPAAAQRTVVFSEDSNGFYINGAHFYPTAPPMFTVHIGTVERWQVVNTTEEVHDFHMHQTHFYVESINGTAVAHPNWADSVVVPHRTPAAGGSWKPGYITIVVDFRDPVIRGTFMFHCHILDHEDNGMMAKILAI